MPLAFYSISMSTPPISTGDATASSKPYGIIYCATNKANGKRYIGQTVDFSRRKSQYRQRSRNPKTYFEHAVAKYGMKGFVWEIVDSANCPTDLDSLEKKWISHYSSNVKGSGYNQTDGGGGTRICTENCRLNMSKAAKRKFANGFTNPNKGKKAPKHVIDALHAGLRKRNAEKGGSRLGWKPTEEERQLMSERLRGRHCSPRTEIPSKPIVCVEIHRIFPSIGAAARHFNRSPTSVHNALNGQSKTCAGYHWKYLDAAPLTTPDFSVSA